MRVRLYRPDDIDAVVDLWHAQWHADHPGQTHAYARERWEYVWHSKVAAASVVWTAWADGDLAGYAAVRTQDAVIDHVIVAERFRRRGVGLALVERAKWVHPRGFRCYTGLDNRPMIGLLSKAGLFEKP